MVDNTKYISSDIEKSLQKAAGDYSTGKKSYNSETILLPPNSTDTTGTKTDSTPQIVDIGRTDKPKLIRFRATLIEEAQ